MVHSGYKDGKYRPFLSTFRSSAVLAKTSLTKVDHALLFVLTVMAAAVRLHNLAVPNVVVFDEVHFGKFAREYLYGDFFLDVHPPLAKLYFAFIAILTNWDAEFDFAEVGKVYPDAAAAAAGAAVPYVQMRLFAALCGVATVLLAYGTLRASGCRSIVALFGTLLVIFENSMVTQSRFILLDGPLLFGVALAVFGYKKFQLTIPFSGKWWKFLLVTGIGLGVSVSTKWSGFFTFALVGALTLTDLWTILGDLDVTVSALAKHTLARAFALIAVPLAIYLAAFAAHFRLLTFNTNAIGVMSPNFKQTLEDPEGGVNWTTVPSQLSYGSVFTLKHQQLGGYLHSHEQNYPGGSKQQQVTVYEFDPDTNNQWVFEMKQRSSEGELERRIRPVKEGDILRILHRGTGKFLTVSDERPPLSDEKYNNEVSCAGDRGMDPHDVNYEWRVKIVAKRDEEANNIPMIKMRAGESVFQLVHVGTKCILYAHEDKLPEWGSRQMEVMCAEEPTIPNTLWYVEHHTHPLLEKAVQEGTEPAIHLVQYGFWDKLIELHQVMWSMNKGITDSHAYESSPETWPLLLRGVSYFSGPRSVVYYLGNGAVYWATTVVLLVVLLFSKLPHLFRSCNPFRRPGAVGAGAGSTPAARAATAYADPLALTLFQAASFEYLAGWALNYFPYFHMKRQTFLHHYLPALYFSILLLAQYAEYQYSKRKWLTRVLMALVLGATGFCYYVFSPLIYGSDWTVFGCLVSRWFPGWDFDCLAYQ